MAYYNKVSKGQDTILRGADQQQTSRRTRNLLYEGPVMKPGQPEWSGSYPPDNPTARPADAELLWKGLKIHRFELVNGDAASLAAGIGFRYSNDIYEAGSYDDSATTKYAQVANFQGRTSTSVFGSIATPANEDGLVIQCTKPFNWVSINVTTASAHSVNTVSDIDYVNEAGTGWITQTASQSFVDGLTESTEVGLGEAVLAWAPPHDWGTVLEGGALETAGLRPGWYAMIWRFGTVPDTTDPAITGLEIGSMQFSGAGLASNGLFENENMDWVEFDADGVVALFSTADPLNIVSFEVQPVG